MLEVKYQPAESTFGLFGGNSNWRGTACALGGSTAMDTELDVA
jgi:hypothetical protein